MTFAPLETERLLIRDFTLADLDTQHRLNAEAFDSDNTVDQTREWLTWTIANYTALARLYQPPYGDRAITLKTTGEMVGSVGLVPAGVPWQVMPEFRAAGEAPHERVTSEFGLFWSMFKAHRGNGYAVEAARALIDFAFTKLNVRRIVATTEHKNANSQRVMEKLGMTLYRNPGSDPFWFNVVGVLNHPGEMGVSV
jgi:ribosomal-protein-alanine N-acetyltransferase